MFVCRFRQCVWCASEVVSEGRYRRHCSLILQPPLPTPTPCPQEYSTGSTSRTVLVLYTSAIFVNACSPLFLHLMLLRRTQQGAVAKWIRSYLLFDAVFDSMYVEWGEGPAWAVVASLSLSLMYVWAVTETCSDSMLWGECVYVLLACLSPMHQIRSVAAAVSSRTPTLQGQSGGIPHNVRSSLGESVRSIVAVQSTAGWDGGRIWRRHSMVGVHQNQVTGPSADFRPPQFADGISTTALCCCCSAETDQCGYQSDYSIYGSTPDG